MAHGSWNDATYSEMVMIGMDRWLVNVNEDASEVRRLVAPRRKSVSTKVREASGRLVN